MFFTGGASIGKPLKLDTNRMIEKLQYSLVVVKILNLAAGWWFPSATK
jgi:hypothetical protein